MTRNAPRGQIIFRQAIGATESEIIPIGRNPFGYFVGVGVIECDTDAFAAERIHTFTLTSRDDDLHTGRLRLSAMLPSPTCADADLGGVAATLKIEAPPFGALTTCGGLYARKTRFPSPQGRETLAIVSILRSANIALKERALYKMSIGGDSTIVLANPQPLNGVYPRGSTIAEPFSLPIWGFGEEPRAIKSTLTLELIDACAELTALFHSDTKEAQTRIEELKYSSAWFILASRQTDHAYAAFLARMHKLGHPSDRFDTYPTAEEIDRHQRLAEQAFAEVQRESIIS